MKQAPPIEVPPHNRIDAVVKRLDAQEQRVADIAAAVEEQAALNRTLWIKLRQGWNQVAAFVEKVHIRGERYRE